MSLASEILARRMRLPRAQTREIVCEPDLRAAMDDGAVLLADRWVARAQRARHQPTVLVRSPYGRRQGVGLIFGRLLAERGLQVVIQSVRGTFGSEGTFSPFDERADGLATLRWIEEQPWHRGPIGMIGPSYLGLVQWAVGADAGAELGGLAIQFSASQFHAQTYAGGSLSLETTASWLVIVAEQERRAAPIAIARTLRRLPRLLSELPLADLDELATGGRVDWYRDSMAHPLRDDTFWGVRDYTAGVTKVTAPVQLVGGWYDIFLPWMLEDFCALQAAGLSVQLIVGPWTHTGPGGASAGIREGIAWLRAQLLGDSRLVRPAAIRLLVTGERSGGGWRELESWPPPDISEYRLWLGDHGRLEELPPRGAPAAGDRYRYDPSDPTPSLGGPVLLGRRPVVDNRPLEARSDVLTYTAPALQSPLEAIGPVRVELFVRAGSPFFDIFARVCDVDAHGTSWNVCDALARVGANGFEQLRDGSWRVAFDLWPMGHRFAAGHRVRLQVSSGAHPRYARNPGNGEDPMTATALRAVDIEILHDEPHPSQLILPRSGDSGLTRSAGA
ncbi:MAG: CocE/NonD family hydrolase [Solirubrobacterales bacterium]|nr:CocE/NonD family hydrolase [Solirubrobacterales bacterium]MBV9944106.1 CocE/NonD family hydrolase [Solirubrobacterales bacterium]